MAACLEEYATQMREPKCEGDVRVGEVQGGVADEGVEFVEEWDALRTYLAISLRERWKCGLDELEVGLCRDGVLVDL